MISESAHPRVNLLGKSVEELREFLASRGEPGYRGAQIYHALYAERRLDFAAMTNLPGALRERLGSEASIALPQIVRRFHSADGTVRYVLALAEGKAGQRRDGVHARGKPADDLHFDAGGLRGGLQVLPDGDAGAAAEGI